MLATLITSGIFTRPTQAEFLDLRPLGCALNIGVCPPEGEEDPVDPETPAEPTESDDEVFPIVSLKIDPALAGGNTQTVTISGTVSDDNLTSYRLSLEDNTVQQVSDISETTATFSVPWSVASPNKISSGMYKVMIEATDKAGNTTTDTKMIEVDNDGPNVVVSGGDVIIESGSISPTVDTNDPHEVASYAWRADPDTPAATYEADVKEPTFTPTDEGSYVFYVDVSDSLGNVTTGTFSFDYARELAEFPLPINEKPADQLVTQNPSTPVATTNSTPAIRSTRDEVDAGEDSAVLGNTVVAADQGAPVKTAAVIAPTTQGWSILGFLWYWWLALIGAILAAWLLLKKFVFSRLPEHS